MAQGLTPTRTRKLTAALETLPAELRYLRTSILSIAKQNQDLLGCGGGDCSVFDDAWKQEAANCDPSEAVDKAASHAEALQEWASKFGNETSVWLAPVWFLTGYFQGPAFGGVIESQDPVEFEPSTVVAIDIPQGFYSNEIAKGWSFGDEYVFMILLAIRDTVLEQLKREMCERVSQSSAELDHESTLREGHSRFCDPSFRQGDAAGLRYLECLEAGRASSARYFLSVPGGSVQLFMNSRSEEGFEWKRYEPLIESIRLSRATLAG